MDIQVRTSGNKADAVTAAARAARVRGRPTAADDASAYTETVEIEVDVVRGR